MKKISKRLFKALKAIKSLGKSEIDQKKWSRELTDFCELQKAVVRGGTKDPDGTTCDARELTEAAEVFDYLLLLSNPPR